MKINYITESNPFGNYKDKSINNKEIVNRLTKQAADKDFKENILPEIAEYYCKEYKARMNQMVGNVAMQYVNDYNDATYNIGVSFKEGPNDSIIINQRLTCVSAGSQFYITNEEEIKLYDDLEKEITEKFRPCKILLTHVKPDKWRVDSAEQGFDWHESPFGERKDGSLEGIGIGKGIELDALFNYMNRFTVQAPLLDRLDLNYNEFKDLTSKVKLKNTKFKSIFIWGCYNLRSYAGWEDILGGDDPVIAYNINGIFGHDKNLPVAEGYLDDYKNGRPLAFEEATDGAMTLEEIKKYKETVEKKVEEVLPARGRRPKKTYTYTTTEYKIKPQRVSMIYHLKTGEFTTSPRVIYSRFGGN